MDWGNSINIKESISKRKLSFKKGVNAKFDNLLVLFLILVVMTVLGYGIISLIQEKEPIKVIAKFLIIEIGLLMFSLLYIKGLLKINDLKSIPLNANQKISKEDIVIILNEINWKILVDKEQFIYARYYGGVLIGGQEIAIFILKNEILFNSTSVPVSKSNIGYVRLPISLFRNHANFEIFKDTLNERINKKNVC